MSKWTKTYFTEEATIWAILTLAMDICSARLLRFSKFKIIKISIGASEDSVEPIAIAERRSGGWIMKVRE